MKKPFLLIVLFSLLLIFLDRVRSVWLGNGEAPSETYKALLATPPRTAYEPRQNAYLLLLGFSASSSADPLHVGHYIWVEAESDRGHRPFDYGKESRLEARVSEETLDALQTKGAAGAINRLRDLADPAKNLLAPPRPPDRPLSPMARAPV
jgi:hypothetical protein